MRPTQGGPLNPEIISRAGFAYEPKVNGWRALIHVPTLTVFNRHGNLLSISDEFADALAYIWERVTCEWLDGEMLSRRHSLNKGHIHIIDALIPGDYLARRKFLSGIFDEFPLDRPEDSAIVTMFPTVEPQAAWEQLQAINRSIGTPYYEGLVAKFLGAEYQHQMINPSKSTPLWTKHRFDQYQ